MKARKSFTVTNPPITLRLLLGLMAFFVILVLAYTLFSPPPHTAMYVCITLFIFLPGTIISLWTGLYRIQVTGTQISVRKCLGLVRFTLDVSDIVKVEQKTMESKSFCNRIIRVYTSTGKQFPVEALMVNFGKMEKFLKENVEESKIRYVTKKL